MKWGALAMLALGGVAIAADRRCDADLRWQDACTAGRPLGGGADYRIVDGAIVGSSRPGMPNSFLVTEKDYADFILEFDVRQDVGPTNSGVQFRSLSTPEFENGRVHGYQTDIDPSPRQWSGGIYEEAQRGWFYTGDMNPPGKALYKFGEWNHFRIEAIGPRLRVWINDTPAADVIDDVQEERILRPAGPLDRQARRGGATDLAGRTCSCRRRTSSARRRWASSSATTCLTISMPRRRRRAGGCCGTARPRTAGAAPNADRFPEKGWSLGEWRARRAAEGRRRRHHDGRGIRRVRAADGVQGHRRRQQRHLLSTDRRRTIRRAARRSGSNTRSSTTNAIRTPSSASTATARSPRSTTSIRAPSS